MKITPLSGIKQPPFEPPFDRVERAILDLIRTQGTEAGQVFVGVFKHLADLRFKNDLSSEELTSATNSMISKGWIILKDDTGAKWILTELGARNVAATSPVEP